MNTALYQLPLCCDERNIVSSAFCTPLLCLSDQGVLKITRKISQLSQRPYLVEVEHEVQFTHVVEILIQHLTGKRGTNKKRFNSIRLQPGDVVFCQKASRCMVTVYLNVMH